VAYPALNQANAYSFAGENAKTADTYQLSTAKQRLESGEDAEIVRQETGWFKGADKKWRFEIDDSDASLKITVPSAQEMREINNGEWISSSAFMAKYPNKEEAKAMRLKASMRRCAGFWLWFVLY